MFSIMPWRGFIAVRILTSMGNLLICFLLNARYPWLPFAYPSVGVVFSVDVGLRCEAYYSLVWCRGGVTDIVSMNLLSRQHFPLH